MSGVAMDIVLFGTWYHQRHVTDVCIRCTFGYPKLSPPPPHTLIYYIGPSTTRLAKDKI